MDLIGIVRVSRKGQRDDRLRSPEWQAKELRAWATDNGHAIVRIIEEIDVSGGTTNRKALREAKRAVLDGEAHGLAAAYVSRFSRNTYEGLGLVRDVLAAGRAFYALDCPFDLGTPEGQRYLTDRLSEAQYERDRAKRNFAKGVEGAITRGAHLTECFGYRKRADGVLVIDATEGPWVPRVFAWRIEGRSYQHIADALNAAGVRPHAFSARRDGKPSARKRAERWTYSRVAAMLESRTYLGEAKSGEFINPAAHESLIDTATFAKVEAMRSIRPRRGRAEFELSGLLRCAGCGSRMKGSATTKAGKVYRYYDAHRSLCTCGAKIRADVLESAVGTLHAEMARGLRAVAFESTDTLDSAIAALAVAEVMRDDAAKDMELRADSPDGYRAGVRAAEAVVKERRSAVQVARQRTTGISATDDDLDNWSSLPLGDRRRFLAEAFEVIYIAADRAGWAPVVRGELADPQRVLGNFLPLT